MLFRSELTKIIRNKIAGSDESERNQMTGKLNYKLREIEKARDARKSQTIKHLVVAITLLTVAIISTWYLFENDVIINMKLMLCQSAIIGFIAGFKELHVLIMGEKDLGL